MPPTKPKLTGKTALITGAGRGIGRATALLFADHGADLVLVSRSETELNKTAEECRVKGATVLYDTIDIAEQGQIDILFEKISKQFKHVDILINNAARFRAGLMKEYDPDEFRLMLETNVTAPFYLARKTVPMMNNTNGGAIVNVSSFSGCFGVEKFPGFGAYNISKYGLWGLTEILALEFSELNIRVNQVSPSGVDTAMFRKAVPPGVKPDLSPEQVAEKILYLASDDSSPQTGANIMIQ